MGPVEGFPNWMAAADADDLHRVILVGGGIEGEIDGIVTSALLARHHGDGQPGAVETALLLATEPWAVRRTSKDVITTVASSGHLSEPDLDELAERLLAPEVVVVRTPGWIGSTVAVEVETGQLVDDAELPQDTSWRFPRHARPPLRRWASAHAITRHPGALPELRALLDELDAPAAAAVVQGLCDGLDALDPQPSRWVLDTAVAWPHAGVRKLALQRLVERGDRERAVELARRDRDTGIRRWIERQTEPPPDDDQPSLFGP